MQTLSALEMQAVMNGPDPEFVVSKDGLRLCSEGGCKRMDSTLDSRRSISLNPTGRWKEARQRDMLIMLLSQKE